MNRETVVGGVPVGDGHPTWLVAEIGINHNGDVELAKKLIRVAKEAGCQAVKFQKRAVSVVYTPEELAKPREVPREIVESAVRRGVLSDGAVKRLKDSNFESTTNGDLKLALELTRDEYHEIDRYCRECGIIWFASPWDEASVDFLEEFNPPCYKVASASLTDDGLLRHISSMDRPVIISTGMSTMDQIRHAVSILDERKLVVLHCTSTYPAKLEELNLEVIRTFREEFLNLPIGYSDHGVGLYASLCAVVLGACIIERHITLSRVAWGSDQAASVEPKGFAELAKRIRDYEAARGDGVKRVLPSEVPIMKKLRRKG